MKSLEEKKLLVRMAKMLGQPVDPELVESIKREEELNKLLFKESKVEEKQVLREEVPVVTLPPPLPVEQIAQTNIVPKEADLIQQTVNVLKATTKETKRSDEVDKELAIMRKTIAEMMQKISTMSWGGGGTGVVRIWDTDDFDRSSAGEGKFMKFTNGWFVLDEINPYEVVHNTTLVTGNTYVVQDSDYYIGANNQTEAVTIILPAAPSSGRMVIIKDESGRAQINPIKIDGNIDNDPGGAEIRINNGGVQLIYRNGWRIV